VPAAKRGDVATVQGCLSKKANIETKDVRSMLACDVVSGIFFDLHVAVFH
jgi:hypothetical protein